MRRVMRSCQKRLNKRSGAKFERTQKEKRLSKISPKELYGEDDEVMENHFITIEVLVKVSPILRFKFFIYKIFQTLCKMPSW
jgi:hypothetical protein